jgi:cell division protein FtsN
MRKTISLFATSCALVLAFAACLPAQQRATLDDVEAQIRNNQLDQARATLQKWEATHKQKAATNDDEEWRAAYLNARLAVDLKDAEDNWLSIAIAAPASSRYKPEALLRVGQAELTQGHARDAISYLKRLVDTYPKSEFAPIAADWLQRAQAAPTSAALPPAPSATTTQPTTAAPRETSVGMQPTPSARWTVQVAAFRDKNGAHAVARQVSKLGFNDVRVVTVPENTLLRVRVGYFKSAGDALDVVAKLKRAGYSAVTSADALREERVHD